MTSESDTPPPDPPPSAHVPTGARLRPSKLSTFLLRVLAVLTVVAAGVGAMALASSRRRAEAEEAKSRAADLGAGPSVAVAKVVRAPPQREIVLTGEVRPYRQSTLYAKTSGYLKAIPVDRGQLVEQGELLGILEAPEVDAQVQSARADVAIKRITEVRTQKLADNGLASQQDRDRAAADVRVANAELSRLETLKGYEVMRAPFTGIVTQRYADPGALLQAATASQSALPLVELTDSSRVRVVVFLGQAEALAARDGDAVEVWAEETPEARTKATITRMAKQLDGKTRTMLTEIEIDNSESTFYPGSFVRVSVRFAAPPSLSVPAEALVVRDGNPSVARVEAGKAHFVKVQLGDTDGRVVRVFAGLAAGDSVVLHPGDEVFEGAPVVVAETK